MTKKVLIVCGSPYANSHSDALATAFANGVKDSGHTVEWVKLSKKKISPCLGCSACRNSGNWECIIQDDTQALHKIVQTSDVIVLVTPLYFLTVSAQLKIFIDRLYNLYHGKKIQGKKSVLLSTSGGPGSDVLTGYFSALCGLVGWENIGTLNKGGLPRSSEGIDDETKREAFEMGKNLSF